jgi:hypothetical protein
MNGTYFVEEILCKQPMFYETAGCGVPTCPCAKDPSPEEPDNIPVIKPESASSNTLTSDAICCSPESDV